jgi:hypothetical protein
VLRCLVADNFWAYCIENLLQAAFICDIDMKEPRFRVQVGAFPAAFFPQTVQDSNLVPCCNALVNDVRPNETRSTSH